MKILTLITLFAPLILFSQLQTNTKTNYLGNNTLSNFEVEITNTSNDNIINTFETGELLSGFNSDNATFLIAKKYEFIIAPNSTVKEKIICYARDYKTFPESNASYQSFKKIDSTAKKLLLRLQNDQIYGSKSQLLIWNTFNNLNLDTTKKHIHSYSRNIKFESSKPQTINVFALVDTFKIDTLIKNKQVGEGEYLLRTNKVILSDQDGEIGYQIDNSSQTLYSTAKKVYLPDSLNLQFPFDFYAKRMYLGTILKAYDNKHNLIETFYNKQTQDKGRNIRKHSLSYYGLETDTITVKLTTKKGEILKEKIITYADLNKGKNALKNKKSYLKINHKYSSRKSENRTSCFIENENGDILATVFKNKNIHTGINKVNYTFTHTLDVGELIYLYVKTSSGRVIAKKEISIQ